MPTAVVEAVDPIVLGCRVLEPKHHDNVCCCCCVCDIPSSISGCLSAPLCAEHDDRGDRGDRGDCRYLVVSLGIFSLVRVVRPAQYLVSACEFVIPDKECVAGSSSDPCELFRSMAFPVSEFTPAPMPLPTSDRNRCGCNGIG